METDKRTESPILADCINLLRRIDPPDLPIVRALLRAYVDRHRALN